MLGMRAQQPVVRWLQYGADGKDIVCSDGANRYTRALYGGYTEFRLETSDRPVFAVYRKGCHRNIRFWLTYNGRRVALHETTHCKARYNAGRRTYELSDDSWGRGWLELTAMAQPDTESAIWLVEPHGLKGRAMLSCTVCDVLRPKFKRGGDMGADPADSFEPASDETHRQTLECRLQTKTYVTLDVLGQDSCRLHHPEGKEARNLYEKAWNHHKWLATHIEFDTPDPRINTLGGALMAAADGAWNGEVWLHGAVAWRQPLTGWRAGYLGDVLGLPERARSHFSAYAESQVTQVEPTVPHPSQDPEKNMARAEKKWGTQMYSNGYIARNPHRSDQMHHYDMNLCYIDELLWHFQYDADTAYMRRMWPVITRHLDWEKRNFDPDDDGLYDAYCCIWASDALYYNSGAVTHSSAYNYRAFALAARVAELIGEDPAPYRREAEKTLRAMNSRLWLPGRGHWAEYQDYMGLRRLHEHAALWSVYTPIDCGAATPEQAFRATQYVDSCIPHIPLDKGWYSSDPEKAYIYTLSTSDWMPYEWSVNNVAEAEVMHTALAYFLAGRNNEGYRLMTANILDQAYMGDSPGNFGQISFYDKARGELYRDFSDNTGISARTLIQGLFGVIPNALYGQCVIRPGFPDEWDHATIRTPYLTYSFRRKGNQEIYEVEQHFARPLQIILRQNTGDGGYVETVGTSEQRQQLVVSRPAKRKAPEPLIRADHTDGTCWGNNFDDVRPGYLETVLMDSCLNSRVDDIFKNEYRSPRSPFTTLQIPLQGIGDWCHPETTATIDDTCLRALAGAKNTLTADSLRIPFRYMSHGENIAYTSLFDNYPDSLTVPLSGRASHAYLLMAGSTNHMQSRIDNGLLIARYADNSTDTLRLQNPHNWCPIEQDYYEDGLAFHASQPRPYRIDFASGRVSRCLMPMGWNYGRPMPNGVAASNYDRHFTKGAGIILDMPLCPKKELRGLTLRTLSNDVVIGLAAITLQRK